MQDVGELARVLVGGRQHQAHACRQVVSDVDGWIDQSVLDSFSLCGLAHLPRALIAISAALSGPDSVALYAAE